jgi:hypothetical protein
MDRAANPGRAAEREPVYAYGVRADVASRLDPTRFDVRTVVVRRDSKPLTSADLEVIESALAAAAGQTKSGRKTAAKRVAARVGRTRRNTE